MEKIRQIKKRNGEVVSFDGSKIVTAIEKAFISQGLKDSHLIAEDIKEKVIAELSLYFGGGEKGNPTVEQTQDLVEKYLMETGNFEVAKAYILYRFKRAEEEKRLNKKISKK